SRVKGEPFDPYPFILLNLFLSMLAAIQAPVIMMSQNRQDTKDRIRSELDYQVNLKAELEILQLHEKFDDLRREILKGQVRRSPPGRAGAGRRPCYWEDQMPRPRPFVPGTSLVACVLALVAAAGLFVGPAVYGADLAKATFAGGCFWCMEKPFEDLPGVVS